MNPVDITRVWCSATPAHSAPDGLQTLRGVLIAIDGDRAMDRTTALHLGNACRSYLSGRETDITKSLGLRPGQGRCNEAPLVLEQKLRRDALILESLQALGGDTPSNRHHLRSLWAGCDHAQVPPPVSELRAMHGGRPVLSEKQISRIAKGQSSYSQRCA